MRANIKEESPKVIVSPEIGQYIRDPFPSLLQERKKKQKKEDGESDRVVQSSELRILYKIRAKVKGCARPTGRGVKESPYLT